MFYAKTDALKLEQFLKRKQEGAVRIIKQKCLGHSKTCEACNILSRRQESNRENQLIKNIWENIKAEPGPYSKQIIRHSYIHRHDVGSTFPLWRSNVKEARAHAKKVINKARRQGSLDVLKSQVEKMVKMGAFV